MVNVHHRQEGHVANGRKSYNALKSEQNSLINVRLFRIGINSRFFHHYGIPRGLLRRFSLLLFLFESLFKQGDIHACGDLPRLKISREQERFVLVGGCGKPQIGPPMEGGPG